MNRDLFVDISYVLATITSADVPHYQALAWASRIESGNIRLVTTQAVLLEVGNALSRRRFRDSFVAILDSFLNDANVEIVPLSPELFAEGYNFFRQRMDKDWGLVDCISFVVMQQRGLTEALTADKHFQQMGFRALLLEG